MSKFTQGVTSLKQLISPPNQSLHFWECFSGPTNWGSHGNYCAWTRDQEDDTMSWCVYNLHTPSSLWVEDHNRIIPSMFLNSNTCGNWNMASLIIHFQQFCLLVILGTLRNSRVSIVKKHPLQVNESQKNSGNPKKQSKQFHIIRQSGFLTKTRG